MSLPLVTGVAPRWDAAMATLASSAAGVHLVRRCADVTELVGVAAAGLARVALVSSDLRGLDRSVLDRLRDGGVAVVAVHPPGEEEGARRLRRWGVLAVLPADLTVQQLDDAVTELTSTPDDEAHPAGEPGRGRHEARGRAHRPAEADITGSGAPAPSTTEEDLDRELRSLVEQESVHRDEDAEGPGWAPSGTDGTDGSAGPEGEHPGGTPEPGKVVVVWGAYGSAGRTTVAVNLAAELAGVLDPVILVDADTYGASVAQALSILDEAPGLAAVCRAADQGTLDKQLLARHAPEVRPGLRVLTGLPRPDRWPEIRESALADVIEQARSLARWVVVDVAPLLEQDEELSFDTAAPRRNGATLTALQAADRVVVVGAGDPLGLQRLVRALDGLQDHTRAPRTVVVTRVRPGPVGPDPRRRIEEALHRFAGVGEALVVPEDRDAVDAAMLHGRALVEVRASSPARQALRGLAAQVAGRGSVGDSARGAGRRLLPWRRGRGAVRS